MENREFWQNTDEVKDILRRKENKEMKFLQAVEYVRLVCDSCVTQKQYDNAREWAFFQLQIFRNRYKNTCLSFIYYEDYNNFIRNFIGEIDGVWENKQKSE